ncbi:MAG: DUF930 domain-containing protein [Allorhizobium sp.]
MQQIPKKPRRTYGWGILASVLTHAVLAALLIFGLPLSPPEPPKDESVSVELVPPPEEPKAEEPEPEKPPEEVAKAEPPPPPEPAPEEKPPEPEPEQTPPPETPDESAGTEEAAAPPLPVLKPVFQFGDKDSGPRKSADGNAAEEAQKAPPTPPEDKPEEAPTPAEAVAEDKPAEVPPVEPATDEPAPDATVADVPVPEEPVPDVGILGVPGEPANAAGDGSSVQIVPEPPVPTPRPVQPEKTSAAALAALTEAKTLFSQSETNDLVAITATGGETAGERAGQLCATELREQLRRGVRQYRPELLPSYRLNEGTVLEVPDAAFRANGQWFNISFRCTLDADVTKILSFAFDVGDPVPRSEWKSRGFPAF